MRSTSTSAPARSSPCSVPTAPARRPPCERSPVSSARCRARSASTASTSPGGRLPARARLGIAHVPEGRGVFFGLTVAEHFRLGSRGEHLDAEVAYEYFPALAELADRRAGLLSGGEQQMLALGRALARRPRLLLLDELSLGLAPVIVERLLPVVSSYAAESGCAVLLVEQHIHIALAVAEPRLRAVARRARHPRSGRGAARRPRADPVRLPRRAGPISLPSRSDPTADHHHHRTRMTKPNRTTKESEWRTQQSPSRMPIYWRRRSPRWRRSDATVARRRRRCGSSPKTASCASRSTPIARRPRTCRRTR